MTLTLSEVTTNLTNVDFSKLPKPSKNKGSKRSVIRTCIRYTKQFKIN